MARKRNNAEIQQENEERFAKHEAMLERILGELQALTARIESKSAAMLTNNSNCKPYLKLRFPRFGGDDPTGWVYQAEQYFDFQKVAEEDQVELASFHLDGIALQWHRWYTKTRGPLAWSEFITALLSRFGPTDYEDPSESLHRVKQLTTVAVYVEAFERLSHRVDGLPGPFLMGCFVGGLKEEIRLEVKIKKPRTLAEAIGLVRLVEEKINLQGHVSSPNQMADFNYPTKGQSNPGLLGPGLSQRLALPAPKPIRRISATEARERREKGLCYFCDEQYVPDHKCSNPQLFMISDVHEVKDKIHVDEPPVMGGGVLFKRKSRFWRFWYYSSTNFKVGWKDQNRGCHSIDRWGKYP